MTTLISEDEKELLELTSATGARQEGGDMVISASVEEIDRAGEWMGRHGVSGVAFDPYDDVYEYRAFMFVRLEDGQHAIRLY